MKLTNCYIKEFGKLEDFEISFNKDATFFYEKNGYGKTTFSNFIISMLYGFERAKNDANDRIKYTPIGKSQFSGNLNFEFNNKTYEIFRIFDAKSLSKDKCELSINSKTIDINETQKIMSEILPIDKESFKKFYFISSDEIDVSSTNSISAAINASVSNDNYFIEYEDAIRKINDAKILYSTDTRSKKEYKDIKEKIASIELRLSDIDKAKEDVKKLENEQNQNLNELNKLYGVLQLSEQKNNLQRELKYYDLTTDENNKFIKLNKMFKNSVPTNYGLNEIYQMISENQNLEAINNNKLSEYEDFSERKIFMNFEKNEITSDLDCLEKEINDKRSLETQNSTKIENSKVINQRNSKIFISLLILSLLLTTSGACLFLTKWILIAISVLCTGVLLGLIICIFYCITKKKIKRLSYKKEEINNHDLKISKILIKYSHNADNNANSYDDVYKKIRSDFDKYLKYQKIVKEINDNNSTIAKNNNIIKNFFASYSLFEEFRTSLDQLKYDVREYVRLNKKVYFQRKNISKLENEIEKIVTELDSLGEKNAEVKNIKDRIGILLNEKIMLLNKIKDAYNLINNEETLLEEYKLIKHKKENFEKRNWLINKAIDFMKIAKENFDAKYFAPVKKEFDKYIDVLKIVLKEDIRLVQNYEIQIKINGKFVNCEYLSSGYKAIIALCYRLAMIDNLEKQKNIPKSFVIMDDPFVALDDEHLQRAKQLVKEISKERQIIYLTCHKSRVIEF
ncbi:ATP-binding protein [Mycoplasmopsis primatum]|uniref:ATP-binding protein n=1 Tax=Mycoplasmopsis primatum TaxID=55604 RepID=UPI000495B457|nr:AAA family ATPase [Mycoplasmopsis primatum]